MFTEVACVVICCDGCGKPGFDSGDGGDYDAVLHFDTLEEAEEVAREAGWFTGPDAAVCRRCLEHRECELTGHDWSEWRDFGPLTYWGGIYVGLSRRCWRCWSAVEYDPPVEPVSSNGGTDATS